MTAATPEGVAAGDTGRRIPHVALLAERRVLGQSGTIHAIRGATQSNCGRAADRLGPLGVTSIVPDKTILP
ncbi:MAG: hypothetical protein ACPHDT_08360 [Acidimicrobiales bacterium]